MERKNEGIRRMDSRTGLHFCDYVYPRINKIA
jgi:hypothetical protein